MREFLVTQNERCIRVGSRVEVINRLPPMKIKTGIVKEICSDKLFWAEVEGSLQLICIRNVVR